MAFKVRKWSGKNKYGSIKTKVGAEVLDSKREARDYQTLLILERTGKIKALKRQVRVPLVVNGKKVCDYIPDFVYFEPGPFLGNEAAMRLVELVYGGPLETPEHWRLVLHDSKGWRTHVFILKKKLVAAIYGLEVRET